MYYGPCMMGGEEKGSLSYFRFKTLDSVSTSIKNSNMFSVLVRQGCLSFCMCFGID